MKDKTKAAAKDIFLLVLSLVFLLTYAMPIMFPGMHETGKLAMTILFFGAWALFVIDYFIELSRAENKKKFFKQHLFALVLICVPMLYPLRLFLAFTAFTALNKVFAKNMRNKVLLYTIVISLLVIFIGSLMVTSVERAAGNAAFDYYGNGLWFTVEAMSTVGFGDMVPISWLGKIITALLMLSGVVLFGVVAGFIASFLSDIQKKNK
jgi:voltage-gated potassium channel